jgi:hypothetical protein
VQVEEQAPAAAAAAVAAAAELAAEPAAAEPQPEVADTWEEAAVDDWEAMDLDEIKLPGQQVGRVGVGAAISSCQGLFMFSLWQQVGQDAAGNVGIVKFAHEVAECRAHCEQLGREAAAGMHGPSRAV